MAHIYNGTPFADVSCGYVTRGANQKRRDLFDGFLRRTQADPLNGPIDECLEPLDGDSKVGAPLVPGHGVNLVDDDRLDAGEELAAPLSGEQDVQRLGSRDQDVRGLSEHPGSVAGGGIAR